MGRFRDALGGNTRAPWQSFDIITISHCWFTRRGFCCSTTCVLVRLDFSADAGQHVHQKFVRCSRLVDRAHALGCSPNLRKFAEDRAENSRDQSREQSLTHETVKLQNAVLFKPPQFTKRPTPKTWGGGTPPKVIFENILWPLRLRRRNQTLKTTIMQKDIETSKSEQKTNNRCFVRIPVSRYCF